MCGWAVAIVMYERSPHLLSDCMSCFSRNFCALTVNAGEKMRQKLEMNLSPVSGDDVASAEIFAR